MVTEQMCKHGYVCRDIEGEDRFLCKECGERFPRHPKSIPTFKATDGELALFNKLAVKQFREGMTTFTDAVQKTQFSIEEFNKALKALAPLPDEEEFEHFEVRTGKRQVIKLPGTPEPQRTSCPAEIENIFGNADVTLTDLEKICERFPDIVSMDHTVGGMDTDIVQVDVGFCDGTTQMVYMVPGGYRHGCN